MWTEAGARLLIADFPPDGCTIGLYTIGDQQPEMVATRGTYLRQPSGNRWQARRESGVWIMTGPEVAFTGFVTRTAAIGWLLYRAQTVLCFAPFADNAPRSLFDEADRLVVTPQLLIRLGETL
jgi:hypothetical protein